MSMLLWVLHGALSRRLREQACEARFASDKFRDRGDAEMKRSEEWRVMALNMFTRRWQVFARGDEERCRRVFFIEDRAGPSMPYAAVKLVPPRARSEEASS